MNENDTNSKFDPTNKAGMHVVMAGNPVDGFRFIGPFPVPSEAIEWATNNCSQEWWPVQLESTEGFEG